jgi:type VI secretion system protein VasD
MRRRFSVRTTLRTAGVVGGLSGMLSLAAAWPLPLRADASAAVATPLELTIVGGPGMNPNAQGRASPVVVRIFDLKAVKAFEAADYPALFERPGEALKDDLVAQEEFVLRPGEIRHRDRILGPQVQALGVAAAFREMATANWHLTVPVTPGRRNLLLIDLDADKIRLPAVDPGRS